MIGFLKRKRKIKPTTIFKQLILNVVTPVVLALVILAGLNYFQTNKILVESNKVKNYIITDEIKHIMELQDVALRILEERMDKRLEKFSSVLVDEVFVNTDNIIIADLDSIRKAIGLNPEFDDIYVISMQGIVVNTTFEEDLHLNFFDFGEDHKHYLQNILKEGKFVSERFAIEHNTKRLKKYTYQPTTDGKFIIELGSYSEKADEIISLIQNTLRNISKKEADIIAVDLFISENNPFSLNKDAELKKDHKEELLKRFQEKDTSKLIEKEDGKEIHTDFIYMERENTDLYKGSVIRIVSDRSKDNQLLTNEMIKSIIIFLITIIAVILIIYYKTRVITQPIKKLVQNVNRIADGNLEDRAEIEGNNEITTLSEHFNMMLERIEAYYNELEEKVKERTAEIAQKKEEIEAQRDALADKNDRLETAYKKIEDQNKHITDSIKYAKRIQTAILPPDYYVQRLLPKSFILYLPKDIVSGDFYWLNEKDGQVMFSAVDCTGHGVPGAFMSIVGNDQLNYAVNVKGARKPAEILDALNSGVANALRQDTNDFSSVKDGMDLALCAIDFKTNKLQFSGAYNPLYHIRNKELTEIKGNKNPIGLIDSEDHTGYTNHEIDLLEGDTIYIFSDGYADQFGGPKGKKFMYRRFREYLIEIQDMSMEDQKNALENKLLDWRGDIEQIDDIIVIGVKI